MSRSRSLQGVERIVRPGQCARAEIEAFRRMVEEGGQVVPNGLARRIAAAHWLGFYYLEHDVAGIAALKRPAAPYRRRVFRQAGVFDSLSPPRVELGWVYTKESYRGNGIARRLCESLLGKAPGSEVLATVRQDNVAMRNLLTSLGFRAVGRPYIGLESGKTVELWMSSPVVV